MHDGSQASILVCVCSFGIDVDFTIGQIESRCLFGAPDVEVITNHDEGMDSAAVCERAPTRGPRRLPGELMYEPAFA